MSLHRFKNISLMLLVIANLLLITGCSSFSDLKSDMSEKIFGRESADAPDPLPEIKQTATTTLIWQAKIGASEDTDFTPVIEAGYVYAASSNGEVVKLDATNGKQIWRLNAGEKLSGGVGVGGSLVLVGTQKGVVFAYDIEGKLQWKSKLSSEILSPPRYFDGVVITRTGDSRIYGINANDGSRKWVYDRTSPALTLRSSAGVVVDGGAVYAGFGGGK